MSSLRSLEKVSLTYDHWLLRKWRKKAKIYVFLRIFFLRRRCILTYLMQLGVLGRTSVEPITAGLSQRGRLLGAVAQWQLRLCFWGSSFARCSYGDVFGARALRDAHMVTFFFRRFRDMCQFFKLVRQISQNPEQIWTPCFR